MATPNEKFQVKPFAVSSPTNSTKDKKDQSYVFESNSLAELAPRQKWYQYFSPSDTPEEKRLILKLDGLIMVFLFLAHWAKVLDSSATSTAYVSGMREDLKMFGNELNYLNTVYMSVSGLLKSFYKC